MDAACVKRSLLDQIENLAEHPELYCQNPGRDFTRKRKLSFSALVSFILNMHGGSMTHEIIDFFLEKGISISTSAVVQMRDKLKAEVFRALLLGFNKQMEEVSTPKTENGLRILAVDGSDIQIPVNTNDAESFFPGTNGQKPYDLLHMNALYDLKQQIYLDAIIQKRLNWNEHKALIEMAEASPIDNALVIADRGYESYNNLAHLNERGWFYLIRIKDGRTGIVTGLDVPNTDEFDLEISMNFTRSLTNEVKELCKDKNHYRFIPQNVNFDYLPLLKGTYGTKPVFYNLNYRIVRVRINSELLETLVTNLPAEQYPPDKLKELYELRWGIETSFRSLKYTVVMLHFHSKKAECIFQEVFASLVIYNLTEWITAQVIIQKPDCKHAYRVNFTAAVHICRKMLSEKMHPPDVEILIAKYIVPIRPNRKYERCMSKRGKDSAINFIYRIA